VSEQARRRRRALQRVFTADAVRRVERSAAQVSRAFDQMWEVTDALYRAAGELRAATDRLVADRRGRKR